MIKPPIDVSTVFLLAETSRLMREHFRRSAVHLNLTQPQYRMLLALSRRPGINQTDLASLLEVHPVTITQSVDRLVKADWVRRERHATDRRVQNLFLTERAEPILEDLNQISLQTSDVALAGFNDRDRKQLEAMLVRVKHNLCKTEDGSICDR